MLSTYWYILFGLALVWYGYVIWVLVSKKRRKLKKESKKLDYLRLNSKFVYNSDNEKTDLDAVLNQITEVEDTSKLLEAFREGSFEDDSNSLTRKKHEKLKIIRNKDSADEISPNSET
ncbi:hypothetical protein [Arenibacter certesii]|uniref:Uncharacterized protein n=1 Tax=Arenibacter certesii TaxID=228955 RepID=A0A918J5N2_9FLAO|nr:hypothetical protein [Arenibacter certesii]GGW49952.1 hypothetical protein GCM10007383_37320 [Arenibacter certesii]